MEEIKGFIYLRTSTYTCGEMTNTVKEYKHIQTGLEFVLIPGGSFRMGSKKYYEDERPIHQVTLSPYLISKTTVTQGVWQKIMGNNPADFQKGEHYPVECISWEDCQIFCEKTGLQLPTEAQWEYACRGGNHSRKWCHGDSPKKLSDYCWYDLNYIGRTHQAEEKKANGFGLYDVHGNVWEWCQDVYNKSFYRSSPEKDPVNDPVNEDKGISIRVLRGGCWLSNTGQTRAAFRWREMSDYRSDVFGLRVVYVTLNISVFDK